MTIEAVTRVSDERVDTILKAFVVGPDIQKPSNMPLGEGGSIFSEAGALEPPYDPETLCMLFEHSSALRQNVDAFVTNVDSFGYRLDPAIDFDAEDADKRIAECLFLERLAGRERGELDANTPLDPTPEEIATRRKELVELARIERARLMSFFSSCAFDCSFTELRRRTRQDLEITGNAYWEAVRNGKGELARFAYVPAQTMRLMPIDPEPVAVPESMRVSPVSTETVTTPQRLRRFVQVQNGQRVYFKSFGDPRIVSRKHGRVSASIDALRAADPSDGPATEVLHFAVFSTRSPYGIPRWIGVLLSVLGSRSAEEVNYTSFENPIPPLAILVSGGRLGEQAVPRVERFIQEHFRGKKAFHKLLILETESGPSGDGSKARIEIKPLTEARQNDALFQNYDEKNQDKIGGAFRLPRLLRGDSRDFNRSVADAQLRFAEDQVFEPERNGFDDLINRRVLGDLGIRFWSFRSRTPITRDPERLTAMIEKLMRAGVLTPEEGRTFAEDVFNRELPKIAADWVKLPLTLTLAGVQNGISDLKPTQPETLVDEAKRLLSLREELRAEEQRIATNRMRLAREALRDPEEERIRVPAHEWRTWFGEEGGLEG